MINYNTEDNHYSIFQKCNCGFDNCKEFLLIGDIVPYLGDNYMVTFTDSPNSVWISKDQIKELIKELQFLVDDKEKKNANLS